MPTVKRMVAAAPYVRRAQPLSQLARVNWAHPSAKGLIYALNAASGTENLADYGGTATNLTKKSAGANIVATPWGLAYKADASGGWAMCSVVNLIYNHINVTKEFSALYINVGGTNNTQGFSGPAAGQVTHYPYSGSIYISIGMQTRYVNGVASVVDLTTPHILCCRVKNGRQVATQNLLTLGTATIASDPYFYYDSASMSSPVQIGINGGYYYEGAHPLVLMWDRFLSDAEAANLTRTLYAPWQLFAPDPV